SFNNTLISIHADNEALPSVLMNLETFICERNYVSIMAQALGLKTIEIYNLSENKFYYSGDANNTFIIDNSKNTLDIYDIVCGLNHFLSLSQVNNEISSSPLYLVAEDDSGSFMTQINGPIDVNGEITYHIK